MASKSWSLGYTIARIDNALHHAMCHLTGSASASYPAALKAGFEALKKKELTTVVAMSGTAMLPTLNRRQAFPVLTLATALFLQKVWKLIVQFPLKYQAL